MDHAGLRERARLKLRRIRFQAAPDLAVVWILSGLSAAILLALTLPGRGVWRDGAWFNRDSGVYLYGGWRLLEGDIPYLDFWDHKWPAVYFVNAVGLSLGNGTTWGVLAIEILSVASATALLFLTLRRMLDIWAGLYGATLFLAGLSLVLDGGDTVEEFTLPYVVAAMYLYSRVGTASDAGWTHYWTGVFGAMPILFRPNLAGVGLAIGIVLVVHALAAKEKGPAANRILLTALGASTPLAFLFLCLMATGADRAFLQAAVTYNLEYSTSDPLQRIKAVADGLVALSPSGMHLLASAGWITLVLNALLRRRYLDLHPLKQLAIVAWPIELWLVSLSGRSYVHYYLALLPVGALLGGMLLHDLLSWQSLPLRRAQPRGGIGRVSIPMVALVAIASLPSYLLVQDAYINRNNAPIHADLVAYLDSQLHVDFLLVWGLEPSVNFEANIPAPTRYTYQYALFTGGNKVEATEEFLEDIRDTPPDVLVDATDGQWESVVPPLSEEERARWSDIWRGDNSNPMRPRLVEESAEVFAYFEENYRLATVITSGSRSWTVYTYVENVPDNARAPLTHDTDQKPANHSRHGLST